MRVVNNTVIDNRLGERPGAPWIDVSAHKDGRQSENILIRNNLVQSITLEASASSEDSNLLFDDPDALFVDVAGHDFHLRDDAAAIDQGNPDMAPAVDHDGIPRPQGSAPDLGAYEWHTGTVEPVDAGRSDAGFGDASRSDAGARPDASGGDAATPADASDVSGGGSGCAASGQPRRASFGLLLFLFVQRKRQKP